MRLIPLSPIPNQKISVTLDGLRYDLTIKEASKVMVCDVSLNSENVIRGVRVLAGEMIIPYRYLERIGGGNFLIQTAREELPDWKEFGVSQELFFFSAEELRTIRG